ncbi:MAG: FHA domain-containing protein [Fimbriimonadaceae bacterium]|nr:FHA domain-containing protein [Fimbriimonadaceae bacterium]
MVEAALALGRYLFLALLLLFLYQLYRLLLRDLLRSTAAPPTAGRLPRLVSVSGSGMAAPGRSYAIDGVLTIGRAAENTISIVDTFCSGRHLQVWCDGGRAWVEDLGSTNGTVLDGQKLVPHEPVELTETARLTLGETRFRYER